MEVRLAQVSSGELEPIVYVDVSESFEDNVPTVVDCLSGHPVYVLGTDAHVAACTERRVSAWSEVLAGAVDAQLSEGLVHLCGFSVGGVIALETARLLRDRGREVGLVGLLDSRKPERFPRRLSAEIGLRWRDTLARPTGGERTRFFLRALRRLPQRRWWLVAPRLVRGLREFGIGRRVVLSKSAEGRAPRALLAAVMSMNYEPRPVDFHVVLVATESSLSPWLRDTLLDWGDYLRGGCSVDLVPGDHLELLRETNRAINAPVIRRAFDRVVAPERTVPSGTVLVHPHVYRYEADHSAALGEALGDAGLKVLPPVTLDGPELPRSVEQWASLQIDRMSADDLQRTVHLLGFSFGGLVVLEMARQLRDRGVRVGFVGLLDVDRPSGRPGSFGELMWDHLAAASSTGRRLGWLTYLPLAVARKIGRVAARVVPRRGKGGDSMTKGRFVAAVGKRYSAHRPGLVDFPVDLFTTASSVALRGGDVSLGWSRWFRGGSTVTRLEGDHYTLFSGEHRRGNARAIAERLAQRAAEDR